jgi:hypothetical protein
LGIGQSQVQKLKAIGVDARLIRTVNQLPDTTASAYACTQLTDEQLAKVT